jgi:hypothetical protein
VASSPVRGIQEIQWTRKDGTVGTAYRVRITRRSAVTRLLHATPDEREFVHQRIVEHKYDKKRLE